MCATIPVTNIDPASIDVIRAFNTWNDAHSAPMTVNCMDVNSHQILITYLILSHKEQYLYIYSLFYCNEGYQHPWQLFDVLWS